MLTYLTLIWEAKAVRRIVQVLLAVPQDNASKPGLRERVEPEP